MARYERNILVPYLEDVCSIELLLRKLKKQKSDRNQLLEFYTNKASMTMQQPPMPILNIRYTNFLSKFFIFLVILSIICLLSGVFQMNKAWDENDPPMHNGKPIVMFSLSKQKIHSQNMLALALGIIFGCFAGGTILLSVNDQKDSYKHAYNEYLQKQDSYEKFIQEKHYATEQLPSLHLALSQTVKRIQDAECVRNQIYSINIIPVHYRNVHVACYLYKYFSTSQEDDLDRIIQTMLLDEICRKMDAILDRLDVIILNQRRQNVLFEKQNSLIVQNHREQMAMLARLEKNQAMQLQYNEMIAANTSTAAFFSQLDYWHLISQ